MQLFDQIGPHGIVDLGERREVELVAEQGHQLHALVGRDGLEQVAHVGGVERRHQVLEGGLVAGLQPGPAAFRPRPG